MERPRIFGAISTVPTDEQAHSPRRSSNPMDGFLAVPSINRALKVRARLQDKGTS